jgi:hypothetical protein
MNDTISPADVRTALLAAIRLKERIVDVSERARVEGMISTALRFMPEGDRGPCLNAAVCADEAYAAAVVALAMQTRA